MNSPVPGSYQRATQTPRAFSCTSLVRGPPDLGRCQVEHREPSDVRRTLQGRDSSPGQPGAMAALSARAHGAIFSPARPSRAGSDSTLPGRTSSSMSPSVLKTVSPPPAQHRPKPPSNDGQRLVTRASVDPSYAGLRRRRTVRHVVRRRPFGVSPSRCPVCRHSRRHPKPRRDSAVGETSR